MGHELLEEERDALCSAEDRECELVVDRVALGKRVDETPRVLGRQLRQADRALAPRWPLLEELGTGHGDDEQRPVDRADDVLDQVEERRDRPVHVVEDDDDWARPREVLDERTGCCECRVGARELAEWRHAVVDLRRSVPEIQERQERDALAVGDARRAEHGRRDLVRERLDEPALPDAGFAHDDHVAWPGGGHDRVERVVQGGELVGAVDERRESRRREWAHRPNGEQSPVHVQVERVAADTSGDLGELDVVRLGVVQRTPRPAEHRADQDGIGVPDEHATRADGVPGADVLAAEDLAELDRRACRADDVVLVGAVDAEGHHELHARLGRDEAAVTRRDVAGRLAHVLERGSRQLQLEVVVEQRLDEEERDRPAHRAHRPPHGLAGGDRGILRQDHHLQGTRLGRGLEAPLLVERAPGGLVRVERILLTSRPVQRQHGEPTNALAVGVEGMERRRGGDRLVVTAELDLGLEPVLECRQTHLVEARDLGLQERLEGEVGERRPAPERQRVRERRRALGRRQGRRIPDETLEAPRVDGAGVDPEDVSGGAGLDRLPTERSPEAVDGVLHDRFGGRRRLAVPEVVEQRVHRDDRSRVEREVGEQGALPRTTQREPLTRGANLKWSEQEDFHLTASRYRPRRDRTTGRTGRTGARLASR